MRNLAKVETFDEAQYLANQNLTFTHYGDPATARGILGVPIPTVMKQCKNGEPIALVPTGDPMVLKLKTLFTTAGYVVK